ncbi:hypothetical protein JTB14_007019 [Gonioctena quinquepunctata]|nr:hypothetical protein JTB14_007019 [Gonioctena quinquepunctata]
MKLFLNAVPKLTPDYDTKHFYEHDTKKLVHTTPTFQPVSGMDILNEIKGIKSKAVGPDGIDILTPNLQIATVLAISTVAKYNSTFISLSLNTFNFLVTFSHEEPFPGWVDNFNGPIGLVAGTMKELQRRLTNLNPIIHDFNSVQEKIEFLTDNADTEQNERDNFESDYYDICSTIEEILGKRSGQNESQSIISNYNVVTSVQPLQLQLPILNLETFNGDYNKWIEFRDCFQAIVGKNATLSGVQKLCHLRKCLNRDVLKTIESLSLTDANYEVAWQALSKRYEKSKRIVETHVRKIINFPCLTKESSKDLRNLYDTVNNNLQALQILNQPVDTWDAILVPIITDKLDQKSKREYEVFYIQEMDRNPSDNSSPSIKSLLDIIKKKCDLL